jgi:hypothetical protein
VDAPFQRFVELEARGLPDLLETLAALADDDAALALALDPDHGPDQQVLPSPSSSQRSISTVRP